MSVQAEPPILAALAPEPAAGPASAAGRLLMRLGDRLNPILVKETRQALKSRQFAITFGLLLIAVWVWTIMGMAFIGAPLWYGAEGSKMFFGYYLILALPLLVIVPYGALRSLAGEHEEHTYDLLAITTLRPRQIVGGKLGSSIVQMVIYLSAVSPCLAFTYMLRGIDVPTIGVVIAFTMLVSLGLSVIGLLVGTLSTARHWQVVLSVLAILALFFVFFSSCGFVQWPLSEGLPFAEPAFWQVCAAWLSISAGYIAIVFLAAAARLGFPSENRSTPLRVVMLLQQLLLTGWVAFAILSAPSLNVDIEFLSAFVIASGLHWYVMGVFMTGESPDLSLRVKRHAAAELPGPGPADLVQPRSRHRLPVCTVQLRGDVRPGRGGRGGAGQVEVARCRRGRRDRPRHALLGCGPARLLRRPGAGLSRPLPRRRTAVVAMAAEGRPGGARS